MGFGPPALRHDLRPVAASKTQFNARLRPRRERFFIT